MGVTSIIGIVVSAGTMILESSPADGGAAGAAGALAAAGLAVSTGAAGCG